MKHDLTRKNPRHPIHDYSQPGAYHVTICSRENLHLFGRIANCTCLLSEPGRLVLRHWQDIPSHYDLVELDEFTIMPNHLHGIVVIKGKEGKVGRARASPTTESPTLSMIINGFKSGVTREYGKRHPGWTGSIWQRGYHDHIIRNEHDLYECRRYIRKNPLRWSLNP